MARIAEELSFWYVNCDNFYVVPNIGEIFAQTGEESGGDVSDSVDDLAGILVALGEYGIDIDALLPLVAQWMETGIPLRYEKSNGELKLYVDKKMCRPVIEALLPALPKSDELIAALIAENPDDPEIQMLPMLVAIMGIENFAALEEIWNNNTDEFEISLNFTGGAL